MIVKKLREIERERKGEWMTEVGHLSLSGGYLKVSNEATPAIQRQVTF